jgi:undecaprenyl-phosphate 4-deoxy-4-formamido-L-arabinose transferase
MKLSIVVPVFNEEAVLPLLFARLYAVLDETGVTYEVVFVDDGSTDGSMALLAGQFERRPAVTQVVGLARNVGQHLAILAGLEHVRGDYAVTIDADLQNPPSEIPRVLAALEAGADYVGTIRRLRQDAWWRCFASRALNRIRERTTRIHLADHGCMLRAYDRRIVGLLTRSRETSAFIPALAYTFARRPVEIVVEHEERAAGRSKYSFTRLVRLNFDLMTGFSVAPLQAFSVAGGAISLASMAFVAYLAVRRIVVGPEAEGVFTLFGIAFFLIGALLLGLGIVGEYIGRIYEQLRDRPRYVVATVLSAPSPRMATTSNVASIPARESRP